MKTSIAGTGRTPSHAVSNGPWSTLLSSLGLAGKTGEFKWRTGALVTPRLRLLYPLKDGVRVSEGEDASAASAVDGVNAGSLTWVADHLGLGTRVEVTFGAPNAEAAFQQLARVTAQIDDPHLVRILEQGSVNASGVNASGVNASGVNAGSVNEDSVNASGVNPVPFVVTELLEGKSFRRRLLHGAASLPEVETLVVQACQALTKAHALGITHGALRPDCLYSVELAERPFIKISGFGAPRVEAPAQVDLDAATPKNDYSSPEQLLLDVKDDARSDLWALAVSVYELLTTTLPFEASTPAGVTGAICNTQFAPPSLYRADLPSGVDIWFARALAKDPAARFADAAEFARSFEEALSSPVGVVEPAAVTELEADLAAESSQPAEAPPTLPAAVSSGASSPAAQSPAAQSPPAQSPAAVIPAALGDSLEMEDEDEDEMTVKWDAPSEWRAEVRSLAAPLPGLRSLGVPLPAVPPPPPPVAAAPPPVAIIGSVVPHPLGGEPTSVSAATPGVAYARQTASARQSARTQRISRASLQQAATIPPTLEPSVYMESPYIASIASALAIPSAPSALEPQLPRERFFTTDKTWLAALAFAAGVAVTWFSYDASSGGSEEVAAEDEANIRTVSVDDLPRVEGEDDEDLAIIRTSQLPRAPDDGSEAPRQGTGSQLPRRAAPAPEATVQKVQALAPAPLAAPVPAKAAAPGRTKSAADARENCSPPYYFDKQGIQRVKSECLEAPVVVTGPYGAVMTTTVAKTATAAGDKPAAGDKQARANDSCSPPYYFDGKIRRLKLECL